MKNSATTFAIGQTVNYTNGPYVSIGKITGIKAVSETAGNTQYFVQGLEKDSIALGIVNHVYESQIKN